MPDRDPIPADVLRALGAVARRRILVRLRALSRARAWRAPDLVRRELARLEPLLARTLTDAQLVAFFDAARAVVDRPEVSALDESRGEIPPPVPPPPVPTGEPADPEPLVRFPQIEAAVADLTRRRALLPADVSTLTEDARRTAFTVARAVTLDAVERVRDALVEHVQGGTLKTFRRQAKAALGASALSDAQLDAVARTHEARATAAGQRAILEAPMVQGAFPYLVWSATHDGRVRPDHLAMEKAGLDGTAVYRADDPIWQTYYPPVGWNCRCVVFPLSVRDAAEYGCKEAEAWLESGEPPAHPAFVTSVPVKLPPGWEPTSPRLAPAA